MKILIGVSSSVSIYKVLNIIRKLTKKKHEVKVIMTKNATKMISPLLFESISHNKVFVDNFNEEDPLIHITLAKWGDVFVLLPATANIIGKVANGICDDLVSTTAVAFPYSKRRILVPAMNKEMWANPIVQENISKLIKFGWEIIEPEEGLFASPLEGIGKGRLPDEKTIVYNILRNPNGILKSKKVLITAGATKEYIDNVRFISNDSSGLMGLSLALECYLEGAEVILIHGEMKYKPFKFIKSTKVTSTEEMLSKILEEFPKSDILFMSAAVSDFRPKNKSTTKIPKNLLSTIELEKTPDILKSISTYKNKQVVIGFALGDENIEDYAIQKMKEKKLDYIVANRIEIENNKIVFNPMGNINNKIILISKDGSKEYFSGSKLKIARFLIEKIFHKTT